MTVGRHLKGGPYIVAADYRAVQHLIGVKQRRHNIVDRNAVQQGIGIRSLVLALPNEHDVGKLRIDFVNRISFDVIRRMTER